MNDMFFAGALIWYHTYRQTHTWDTSTNILTHACKYISTPPVTCAHELPVSD